MRQSGKGRPLSACQVTVVPPPIPLPWARAIRPQPGARWHGAALETASRMHRCADPLPPPPATHAPCRGRPCCIHAAVQPGGGPVTGRATSHVRHAWMRAAVVVVVAGVRPVPVPVAPAHPASIHRPRCAYIPTHTATGNMSQTTSTPQQSAVASSDPRTPFPSLRGAIATPDVPHKQATAADMTTAGE